MSFEIKADVLSAAIEVQDAIDFVVFENKEEECVEFYSIDAAKVCMYLYKVKKGFLEDFTKLDGNKYVLGKSLMQEFIKSVKTSSTRSLSINFEKGLAKFEVKNVLGFTTTNFECSLVTVENDNALLKINTKFEIIKNAIKSTGVSCGFKVMYQDFNDSLKKMQMKITNKDAGDNSILFIMENDELILKKEKDTSRLRSKMKVENQSGAGHTSIGQKFFDSFLCMKCDAISKCDVLFNDTTGIFILMDENNYAYMNIIAARVDDDRLNS